MIQIGIIGLNQSGKTTLFNALAAGHVHHGESSKARLPNVAVVKVPDERLEKLAAIVGASRTVNIEIEFIDIAGMSKSKEKSSEAAYAAALRQTSALIYVIRYFRDENIPHATGNINPSRDHAEIEAELILQDLILVENRLEKIRHLLKVRPSSESQKELTLMEKLKKQLDSSRPLRELDFTKEEQIILSGFGFLSIKPVLLLLNIGEQDIGEAETILAKYFSSCPPRCQIGWVCAKIEMELAALEECDRLEFMKELGIKKSVLSEIIARSFDLLGLICFLTGNEKEARAWAVPKGTTAYVAAGQIHSDIQRGFIKAETIAFEELVSAGNWAEARRHGKVRMEGKDYVIRDGEVIQFRFNV